MNEDRLGGTAKNVGGQVEEGFGRATGDVKTQIQGKARQMEGTLQEVYGQAKETAAEAAEAIREAGGEAGDFLRTTIEQRPYTTAAVALGIGYLIGRFGHRPYEACGIEAADKFRRGSRTLHFPIRLGNPRRWAEFRL